MIVCYYFLGLHMNYSSLLKEIIFKRWFVNMNMHSLEVKNISKKCIYHLYSQHEHKHFKKLVLCLPNPNFIKGLNLALQTLCRLVPTGFLSSPRCLFLSPAKFELEKDVPTLGVEIYPGHPMLTPLIICDIKML